MFFILPRRGNVIPRAFHVIVPLRKLSPRLRPLSYTANAYTLHGSFVFGLATYMCLLGIVAWELEARIAMAVFPSIGRYNRVMS
jgi:hypothetical protein